MGSLRIDSCAFVLSVAVLGVAACSPDDVASTDLCDSLVDAVDPGERPEPWEVDRPLEAGDEMPRYRMRIAERTGDELHDRALALACLFEETVTPTGELRPWAEDAATSEYGGGVWGGFSAEHLYAAYSSRDELKVGDGTAPELPEGLDPEPTEPDPGIGWDGAQAVASDVKERLIERGVIDVESFSDEPTASVASVTYAPYGWWMDNYRFRYTPEAASIFAYAGNLDITVTRDGDLRTIRLSEADISVVDSVTLAIGEAEAAELFETEALAMAEGDTSVLLGEGKLGYSFDHLYDPPLETVAEPRYIAEIVFSGKVVASTIGALSLVTPEDGIQDLLE